MRLIDATCPIFQTIPVSTFFLSFTQVLEFHMLTCIRDDLTVEVIFFGNTPFKAGELEVNKEASASASDVKAKLQKFNEFSQYNERGTDFPVM